ncbi:malonyl-CoA O-methyltransferase [Lachnospiraceae bacterium KH1T2]|nr:malonyl-CoA O-methyltransferase [Lachnospiraceae bacterium KH1T2]
MREFIVFGAGYYGKKAINYLGARNILYVIDNDQRLVGTKIKNIEVCNINKLKKGLKEKNIIIAANKKNSEEISRQLDEFGCTNYIFFNDVKKMNRFNNRSNIEIYRKATEWIIDNSLVEKEGKSIIDNSDFPNGYPEVTGYFIPTLMRWGYKDLAVDYAKWLCSIQKKNGAWFDSSNRIAYVFDTAQIIKGLLAVRRVYPLVDDNIKNGCSWIISQMQEDGRIIQVDDKEWKEGEDICEESIHLYCLAPLVEAGRIFGKNDYIKKAYLALDYYKRKYYKEIVGLKYLSHFQAYLIEGLLDMGEEELVRKAMKNVADIQQKNGAVPSYPKKKWVCSTGLFQYAIIWFRIGEFERGNSAFKFACSLQNPSGGWFGSYPLSTDEGAEKPTYCATSEISWASKFFLDALYYRQELHVSLWDEDFEENISKFDERYRIVYEEVVNQLRLKEGNLCNVLDLGCGKGQYLKNLSEDAPGVALFGVDLSQIFLDKINVKNLEKRRGSLTNIPYGDNSFDLVYMCESLEHAIDIEQTIREACRVIKNGGVLLIIDKNIEKMGVYEIEEWEQWFDDNKLIAIMNKFCKNVTVNRNVGYFKRKPDGVFHAWRGIVR